MTEIGAYFYPGWTPHRYNEWDLLKNPRQYILLQQFSLPLRGIYDCSQPEVIKAQSQEASAFGIDAFIFDWYWKKKKIECGEPLAAFRSLDTPLKYSVMWTWKLPKRDFPINTTPASSEQHRWVETDPSDFSELVSHCSREFFNDKNYWRINDRPIFYMYFLGGFIEQLGEDGIAQLLSAGKKTARVFGHNPYFVSITAAVDFPDVGFDAYTGYNFFPDFSKDAPLVQEYTLQAQQRILDWNNIASRTKKHYIPSISAGWDATPRGEKRDSIDASFGFPWSPIVVNNTPENFASFLQEGILFAKTQPTPIVNICAWNEWSEGAHIEPDTVNGYAFLEAIKRLKR